MANSSKSGQHRRRLGSVERLESREVLSADLGLGNLGPGPQTVQHFDFSITGTQVFYSPLGLPSEMKGNCYIAGPSGASLGSIGTYDETLQPIFAPVGPGGSPAFVGATGVCTFDFNLSLDNSRSLTIGTIVSDDTSMITGVLPDGTILVDSTHSPIVSASGICAGLSGTFDGHSQVVMGATFSMHTDVEFSVTSPHHLDMQVVLDMLAVTNNVDSYQLQPGEHHDRGVHDQYTDRYASVDAVFAADSDNLWR